MFDRLAAFDPVGWGAHPADDFTKFPHFRFDNQAQQVFIAFSTDLHRVKIPAEEHPIIAEHLAKYDKLFPALALIFHLVDCAANGRRGPVTKDAALLARTWCEYLEAHARRCYGLLMDAGMRSAQALSRKIEQGKVVDGFTARDVQRPGWCRLTNAEAVRAALEWLEDEGWVRPEKATTAQGGRPTLVYRINPKVAITGNDAKVPDSMTDPIQDRPAAPVSAWDIC